MKSHNISSKALFFVLVSTVPFVAISQKLPNKQEVSLRAPADIKIDGKATEWGGKFQAYNKATDIFYTISNDDENLYLTVQAKYQDVEDKIIRGGITFTINHSLNKKDATPITITYPVLRGGDMSAVASLFLDKSYQKSTGDTSKSVNITDLNQLLDAKSKLINIAGIKAVVADESISVYNTDGIKAASQFDSHVNYTYELAIPLKHLTLVDKNPAAFSYHIKINEPAAFQNSSNTGGKLPPPMIVSDNSNAPGIVATDFWGEYTLAKK